MAIMSINLQFVFSEASGAFFSILSSQLEEIERAQISDLSVGLSTDVETTTAYFPLRHLIFFSQMISFVLVIPAQHMKNMFV